MRRRIVPTGLLAAVILVAGYFAVSGWIVAGVLGRVMAIGGAVTQTERLIGSASGDPFQLNFRGDPRETFGFAFEEVAIGTELGDAPAWLVPGRDGGLGPVWAIHAHGIAGRREHGYKSLIVLHGMDVPVLLISYRNDEGAPAASEGLYALGVTEWRDLDAAAGFALSRGAERLILSGESMGGAMIGQFLAQSARAGAVAALILDAPALDARAIVGALARHVGFPFAGGVARAAVAMTRWRLPIDLGRAYTLPAVAAFQGPLFVAHGQADRIVPVSIGDALVAARAGRPTVYLRTAGDHVQSWQENPDRYRALLTAFLAEAL